MTRIVELAGTATVAKDYPEPEGGGAVAGDAAAAQRRDGRREPVPAAALLVLPRPPGRLPEEGRLQLLRVPGPEQVPRHHSAAASCFIVYPSDLAPVLISLGAKATIGTAKADKVVALEQFYASPEVDVTRENVLAKGQFLKSVWVPGAEAGAEGGLRQAQRARHMGLRARLGGGRGRRRTAAYSRRSRS